MMWVFISIIVVAVGGYFAYYFWDKKRKAKKQEPTAEVERPVVKESPVSVKTEVDEETTQKEEVVQETEESTPVRRDFNTVQIKEENPYAKAIKEMSPEMKAIVFADIFNRKQF